MIYEIIIGSGIFIILVVMVAIIAALFSALLIVIFIKTNHAIFPRIVLFLANILESPIRQILWIFRIDGDLLDTSLTELRNHLYNTKFLKTPFDQRALFLPQCLRHPECPATLNEEGIQCKLCGKCCIKEIKECAEGLGYRVFIAPGSTIVYRMVKKYKPWAVLGVGCRMEIREGTEKLAAWGIPVFGFKLLDDGCVNTHLNINKLKEKLSSILS